MDETKDDLGRPWAGDAHAQRILTQRVLRIVKGKHMVDVAAALGTIMANMVADHSRDLNTALRGIEAHTGDLKRVVEQRFTTSTARH